jgi:hypothetical protein
MGRLRCCCEMKRTNRTIVLMNEMMKLLVNCVQCCYGVKVNRMGRLFRHTNGGGAPRERASSLKANGKSANESD